MPTELDVVEIGSLTHPEHADEFVTAAVERSLAGIRLRPYDEVERDSVALGLLHHCITRSTADDGHVIGLDETLDEPRPTAEDVNRHTYAPSPVDQVYPEDYTGLPT